jgi:NAD(P)-dependent dehydrogenase (short-subunit alcohol dehydrogenase family)
MSDKFSLKGKTIFISGGSGGIARVIARGIAGVGANIVIASRRESFLQEIAEEINKNEKGMKALPVVLDITKIDSIKNAIRITLKEFNKIDVLINCAATNVREPFLETKEKNYDRIMNVNAKGLYFMCQEVGKLMADRKKGKIINIASFVSYIALSRVSAYVASKGAVAQMTKAMAVDLARYNIQVNAIAPGFIKTPFNKLIWANKEKYNWVVEHTLARRFGLPEDLVGTVQFLSSAASDFMTGQIISVDGGLLTGTDALFG